LSPQKERLKNPSRCVPVSQRERNAFWRDGEVQGHEIETRLYVACGIKLLTVLSMVACGNEQHRF